MQHLQKTKETKQADTKVEQVQAVAKPEQKKLKYPNAWLFGGAVGFTIQAGMRQFTMEPLAARPFAYLRFIIITGAVFGYMDWSRRCMLEYVLEKEDKLRYFTTIQAMNMHMRVGDEDETSNLTEYLAGTTTRL